MEGQPSSRHNRSRRGEQDEVPEAVPVENYPLAEVTDPSPPPTNNKLRRQATRQLGRLWTLFRGVSGTTQLTAQTSSSTTYSSVVIGNEDACQRHQARPFSSRTQRRGFHLWRSHSRSDQNIDSDSGSQSQVVDDDDDENDDVADNALPEETQLEQQQAICASASAPYSSQGIRHIRQSSPSSDPQTIDYRGNDRVIRNAQIVPDSVPPGAMHEGLSGTSNRTSPNIALSSNSNQAGGATATAFPNEKHLEQHQSAESPSQGHSEAFSCVASDARNTARNNPRSVALVSPQDESKRPGWADTIPSVNTTQHSEESMRAALLLMLFLASTTATAIEVILKCCFVAAGAGRGPDRVVENVQPGTAHLLGPNKQLVQDPKATSNSENTNTADINRKDDISRLTSLWMEYQANLPQRNRLWRDRALELRIKEQSVRLQHQSSPERVPPPPPPRRRPLFSESSYDGPVVGKPVHSSFSGDDDEIDEDVPCMQSPSPPDEAANTRGDEIEPSRPGAYRIQGPNYSSDDSLSIAESSVSDEPELQNEFPVASLVASPPRREAECQGLEELEGIMVLEPYIPRAITEEEYQHQRATQRRLARQERRNRWRQRISRLWSPRSRRQRTESDAYGTQTGVSGRSRRQDANQGGLSRGMASQLSRQPYPAWPFRPRRDLTADCENEAGEERHTTENALPGGNRLAHHQTLASAPQGGEEALCGCLSGSTAQIGIRNSSSLHQRLQSAASLVVSERTVSSDRDDGSVPCSIEIPVGAASVRDDNRDCIDQANYMPEPGALARLLEDQRLVSTEQDTITFQSDGISSLNLAENETSLEAYRRNQSNRRTNDAQGEDPPALHASELSMLSSMKSTGQTMPESNFDQIDGSTRSNEPQSGVEALRIEASPSPLIGDLVAALLRSLSALENSSAAIREMRNTLEKASESNLEMMRLHHCILTSSLSAASPRAVENTGTSSETACEESERSSSAKFAREAVGKSGVSSSKEFTATDFGTSRGVTLVDEVSALLKVIDSLEKDVDASHELTRQLRSNLTSSLPITSEDESTARSNETLNEIVSEDSGMLQLWVCKDSVDRHTFSVSPRGRQGSCKVLVAQKDNLEDQSSSELAGALDFDRSKSSIISNMSIEECGQDQNILTQIQNTAMSVVFNPGPHFRQIYQSIADIKPKQRLISVDSFTKNIGNDINPADIVQDLLLLSNLGIIRYYSESEDLVFSRFIILNLDLENKVLEKFSSSSPSLQFKRSFSSPELSDHVYDTLGGGLSSLPLLNDEGLQQWCEDTMWILGGVQDKAEQKGTLWLSRSDAIAFIKHVLKRESKILPLELESVSRWNSQDYGCFFVPSMVAPLEAKDSVWSHKSSSWETTLSHIWLLSSAIQTNFMANLSVFLLGKLYTFVNDSQRSQQKEFRKPLSDPLIRRMYPRKPPKKESCQDCVAITQISCWDTALLLEIATTSAEESGEPVTSVAHIFVSLVDDDSIHFVGRDENVNCEKMGLIVSGRSFEAHQGQRLWKSGYKVVVEAVRDFFMSHSSDYWVHERVACPECLCCLPPSKACTWSWESALGSLDGNAVCSPEIRCRFGHRADMHLICGKNCKRVFSFPGDGLLPSVTAVNVLTPGTVLICLYDNVKKRDIYAGSGFIVDKNAGLIVTAAHVLFDMNEGESFGAPLARDSDVRIGIVRSKNGHANVEFVADIIAKDLRNMDACVLHIRTEDGCSPILCDGVTSLEMTTKYEQDESIRLLGYSQGGGGAYEPGAHLNQVVESVRGYIAKTWSPSAAKKSVNSRALNPRQEIVAYCPTISGQSGGPFVTNEGKVVGILSRSDPLDPQRCYIVPAKEIEKLVTTAKYELLNKQLLGKSSTNYFGKM